MSFWPVGVSLGFSGAAFLLLNLFNMSVTAFILSDEIRTMVFWSFNRVITSPVFPSKIVVTCGEALMRALSPLILIVIFVPAPAASAAWSFGVCDAGRTVD